MIVYFPEFTFFILLISHYLDMFSIFWKANKEHLLSLSSFNRHNLLILALFTDFKLENTLSLCTVASKQFF